MIVDQRNQSVDILLGEEEYAGIRIRRMKGIKQEYICKIFQDAKGSLIIEYQGKRIVDEREDDLPRRKDLDPGLIGD